MGKSNAEELGLRIDMLGWRKSLTSAGAMAKSILGDAWAGNWKSAGAKGMSALTGIVKRGAGGIKSLIGGAFRGGVSLGGRAIGGLRTALGALRSMVTWVGVAIVGALGMKAWNSAERLKKSMLGLHAAVASLPEEMQKSFSDESFGKLADAMRSQFGVAMADTAETFGDFLTRGFDPRQATLLTTLAATYAQKTGKPIADVQRTIADAANGSVDAMKSLGIQISATGNAITDGDAAVKALLGSYGSLGTELTSPFDQLRATVEDIFAALGERLIPIFGPLLEKVNLFLTGLLKSEEGRAALDKIGTSIRNLVEMFQWLASVWLRVWDVAKNGFAVFREFILTAVTGLVEQIAGKIADLLEKLPGGGALVEKLGLRDIEKVMGEVSEKSADAWVKAQDALGTSWDDMMAGRQNSAEKFIDKMMEEGRKAQEGDKAALQGVLDQAKGQTSGFAGRPAQEKQDAVAQKELDKRVKAYTGETGAEGQAGATGQQVRVSIVSTRPDRFRKMRPAYQS